MPRPLPLQLVLTLGVLTLAACGEDQTLTQPEMTGAPAPATAALAAASNTWTARAPGPAMFRAVPGMAPNSAGQSIVYLFGGNDVEGGPTHTIWAYNVATNTWTRKSDNFRDGGWSANGVGKIGSKLYLSGGRFEAGCCASGTPRAWAYNPAANTLTRVADMPRATSEGVTGVIDGKLWVLPGTCSGESYPDPGYCEFEPFRRLFRYDPVLNKWGTRSLSPHYHKLGAGGVINGKFYVVGGFGVFDLDVYDPATNTWRTLAPSPVGGTVIGAVLGNKLFVIGSAGGVRRAYAYDPGTNTWKSRAAPAWDHDGLVRVTLDGQPRLLAVGGVHDGPDGHLAGNVSELYTP